MRDVSKGGGGGGGLQRNEHMTFLVDIIDMWGFSYGSTFMSAPPNLFASNRISVDKAGLFTYVLFPVFVS